MKARPCIFYLHYKSNAQSARSCSTTYYVIHRTDDGLIDTPAVCGERRVAPLSTRVKSASAVERQRDLWTTRLLSAAAFHTACDPRRHGHHRQHAAQSGFDHRTRVVSLRTPAVRKWSYPIPLLQPVAAVSNDAQAADVKTTNGRTPYRRQGQYCNWVHSCYLCHGCF